MVREPGIQLFPSGPPLRVASRLNSFRGRGATVPDAIRQMAEVEVVTALELNFPQHFADCSLNEIQALSAETGLPVTALNLRFEGDRFAHGALTAPESSSRLAAVRTVHDAIDCATTLGANHIILWMATDGWDYPFQTNYLDVWKYEIAGLSEIATRNSSVYVSVEYKPYDPRRFSLVRTMGDALLAVREVGAPNLGVTLDVCHAYMAGEHPPAAAAMALGSRKLFGMHLNDGSGRGDDGLVFGSVHRQDALELLWVLAKGGYGGTLYFDTFPVREDPAAELSANIDALQRLVTDMNNLDRDALFEAASNHDAITALSAQGIS